MLRHFENKLKDYEAGNQVIVDKEKWKLICDQIVGQIKAGIPATLQNCNGGLYIGCAGVAYMFYRFLDNDVLKPNESQFSNQAEEYLSVALNYAESKHNRYPGPSFLLGPAGVYCVAALFFHKQGDMKNRDHLIQQFAKYSTECLKLNYMKDGSDELFVGRAGYLCALFTIRKHTGCPVKDSVVKAICDTIIQSGRNYSQQRGLKIPLMYAYYKAECIGAAHGLSSILQFLLRFSQFLDESSLNDVRQSVDFILSIEQSNFNYPQSVDEISPHGRPDNDELVHWCHGAPGVVYMFAQAYKVYADEKYLKACQRCAELVWQKGLLRKGPGICHGVAGSGYVFLLLYRLTNDPKYLHRAVKFAEFLSSSEFQSGARTPDSPSSLYEGWAGTLCFISDLMQPEKAEFPFFDVF
ncbi:hypothetical protein LOTGIDRAFT_215378 [Lottia gigantea]|uniref:LanC-like protein 3 homolog n=2 Tax=Lottia gigantea TaxID=225164 RepID=V4C0B3_LOTGI|nr:hypothetical protein LOTGIDRAFT_215378 [Lottia gigantea]ESO94854.1 hypothetical protein LOTGIDRAFT_215378 [Lottia gigantea]